MIVIVPESQQVSQLCLKFLTADLWEVIGQRSQKQDHAFKHDIRGNSAWINLFIIYSLLFLFRVMGIKNQFQSSLFT